MLGSNTQSSALEELTRNISITLYRYQNANIPCKYSVKVKKTGIIKEVREKLVYLVGDETLKPENVILADVFSSKIYKVFPDTSATSSILENDKIFAYELIDMEPGIHENYEISSTYGLVFSLPFATVRIQLGNQDSDTPFVIKLDKASTTKKQVYHEVYQFLKRYFNVEALQSNGFAPDNLEAMVPHKDGENAFDNNTFMTIHFDERDSRNSAIPFEDKLVNPKEESNEHTKNSTYSYSSYYKSNDQKNYKVVLAPIAVKCIDWKQFKEQVLNLESFSLELDSMDYLEQTILTKIDAMKNIKRELVKKETELFKKGELLLRREHEVKQKEDSFEHLKQIMKGKCFEDTKVVVLNVGEMHYTTTAATLRATATLKSISTATDENNVLATIVGGLFRTDEDKYGDLFIDRNGEYFKYILEYLRNGGQIIGIPINNEDLVNSLCRECDYFRLGRMKYLLMNAYASQSSGKK